jgi:VPDSG-CTERM motif
MKTKTVSSRLALLAIAITVALVIQPLRANPIFDPLVLTENSSASLTATYNGSPISAADITNTGPDSWTVNLPNTVSFTGAIVAWNESANTENRVFFAVEGDAHNVLSVNSDVAGNGSLKNGDTYVGAGTDSSNGGFINVTLFDNGDIATAPDTGTTASLFGLSLAGLAFLRRKLC